MDAKDLPKLKPAPLVENRNQKEGRHRSTKRKRSLESPKPAPSQGVTWNLGIESQGNPRETPKTTAKTRLFGDDRPQWSTASVLGISRSRQPHLKRMERCERCLHQQFWWLFLLKSIDRSSIFGEEFFTGDGCLYQPRHSQIGALGKYLKILKAWLTRRQHSSRWTNHWEGCQNMQHLPNNYLFLLQKSKRFPKQTPPVCRPGLKQRRDP